MSKLLKQKTKSMIEIPFTNVSEISLNPKGSVVTTNSGNKVFSKCVGCKNHPCCAFSDKELNINKFSIPVDLNTNVCSTDAISINKDGSISIESNKCIGCGLCVLRCPLGAICFENNIASVDSYDTVISNPSKIDELKKEQLLLDIEKAKKTGTVLAVNKSTFDNFYEKFSKASAQFQIADLLVRNLFIQLGCIYGIRRRGDVINRIDGILFKNNETVLNEVELSEDVLESPRAVLDDIAIYKYKFSKNDNKTSGLITLAHLPNSRAELWRVIEDIQKVLHVKIDVVSIGTLLCLVWNGVSLKDSDFHFFDTKKKNRLILEEHKIDTSFIEDGYLSIFETKK